MEPEQIMESFFAELGTSLKAMSKAKDVQDRLAISQTIKNLSESLGIFMELATDMVECECDEEEE
jgi:hypothetical protein